MPIYFGPKTLTENQLREIKEVIEELNKILNDSYSIFVQFKIWNNQEEKQCDLLILTKDAIYNLEVKTFREIFDAPYPGDWTVTDRKKVGNPIKQAEDTADHVQAFLQNNVRNVFSTKPNKQNLFRQYVKVFPLVVLKNKTSCSIKTSNWCKVFNGLDQLKSYFTSNERCTWSNKNLKLDEDEVNSIARLFGLNRIENISNYFESSEFVQEIFQPLTQIYQISGPVYNELFWDRETEIEKLKTVIENKEHFLVSGPPKIGKTSLIKKVLSDYENSDGKILIYVSMDTIVLEEDINKFILKFISEVIDFLCKRYGGMFWDIFQKRVEKYKNIISEYLEMVFKKILNEEIEQVKTNFSNCCIGIIMDKFEQLYVNNPYIKISQNYFNMFIKEIVQIAQEKDIIIGLVVEKNFIDNAKKSDILSIIPQENQIFLSGFNRDTTIKFVQETAKKISLQYQQGALNEIYTVTKGHPYLIQSICHGIVSNMNERKYNIVTIQDIKEIANRQKQIIKDYINYLEEKEI